MTCEGRRASDPVAASHKIDDIQAGVAEMQRGNTGALTLFREPR